MRVLRHSLVSLETCISKFQINMERMDAFNRVFYERIPKEEFCTTGTETKEKFGARTQRDKSMLAGFKGSCFLPAAQPLTLTVVFVLSRNAPSQKGRTLRDETREIRPLDFDM